MRFIIIAAIVVSFYSNVKAQYLNQAYNDWYLWTEDNTRLYINEIGTGDSVIVVHGGWGAEHSYLIPAFESLYDQLHFVFYDQRGSLRSPAADSTISLQNFVSDLESLRNELGLEKVILIAHSMGSYVTYAYLKKYPEHVKGIILLAPVLPTGVDMSNKRQADKAFFEFAKANEKKELSQEKLLQNKNLNAKQKTQKWQIGYASGNIYHIDRWEQVKGGQAFFNPNIPKLVNQNTDRELMVDLYSTIKNNKIPIHIIIGDHDLVDFGLTTWPDLANDVSHINLKILKKAGHASWIDQPGKFTDRIQNSISKIKNEN